MAKSLGRRIEKAFERYGPTLDLLREFLRTKNNIQEFILLACARLDSLANLAYKGESQKSTFVKFLARHSGRENLVMAVSVPDLYYFLSYHQFALPGTIDKPGRLHLFDERDTPLVRLVWDSGVGIMQREVGALLRFFATTLKRRYRVTPTQSRSKQSLDSLESLKQGFISAGKHLKKDTYLAAANSSDLLLKDFTVGTLLYKQYRCGIIHEYGVDVDEDSFFQKTDVYYRTVYNLYFFPRKFLTIQFPGRFLLRLLTNTLRSYKLQLRNKKLLPFPLFDEICDFSTELRYLDNESVPLGIDVKLTIPSGGKP